MLTDRGADCAEWGLILSMDALEQLFAGALGPRACHAG
jgi:hypothetical protein